MTPEAAAEDPRLGAGNTTTKRMTLALFCAGVAAFAPMYSPQSLLPDLSRDFGIAADTSSWAVGAATIGVAIGVLPWARLSDRYGRVQTLRVALLCAVVLGALAPLAPTFGLFVLARLFEGLALAAVPSLAVTAIAETVKPAVLGGAVGTYIAGNTIGGLLGRILAAEVAEGFGWRIGLGAVSVVAALFTVIFLLRMPLTVVPPKTGMPLIKGVLANLRTPGVVVLIAQSFLMMGGFVAAFNYLAFRLQHEPFNLTLAQTSWLFLAYLAGALGSRWAWRFADKLTSTGVIFASAGLMVGAILLTLLPHVVWVVLGLVIFTATFFAAHSIASGLAGRRGGAAGSFSPPLYSLGFYAGSSIIGWVGGVAFTWFGWEGTVTLVISVTLLAAAIAWAYARSQGGLRAADAVL